MAVVTGASRGLGAGIAAHLGKVGYALGMCARSRPSAPNVDAEMYTDAIDIRDASAVEAFAANVTEALGPIDLWINNAGVLAPIGPLRDADDDELVTHVDVNLVGVIWGTRTFARLVHNRVQPGTLVNITSGAARSVYAGWGPYCATKAAVDQLTRVIAAEDAGHGLSAFAVAPGVVDTDMQALIRSTPAERFPNVRRFVTLAEDETFNSPAWVAERILEVHRGATDRGRMPTWAADSPDPVVLRIPDEPRD